MERVSDVSVRLAAMLSDPEYQRRLEEQEIKRARKVAESREHWSKRARLMAIAQSGLSVPSYDVETLVSGALEETDCLRHVKRWWASTTRCLVLCGGVGVGKTLAVLWGATAQADEDFAAWWSEERVGREDEPGFRLKVWVSGTTAVDLPRRVEPWKGERNEPMRLGTSLVLVDDLGTEQLTDRWREAWQRLVDAQMGNGRLLVTSNLKRAEIRPRYGDRIADRLNHIGKAVEVRGETRRRKGDL